MPLPYIPLDPALFDSRTRLYRLDLEGPASEGELLLVEAWSLREALGEPWRMELSTLSLYADLVLQEFIGRRVTLQTVLADGSLRPRSGLITAARSRIADGGFARYVLTVQPWVWLLAHTRQSRVWQDKSVVDIVESVLAPYAVRASWRWAEGVAEHLARSPFGPFTDTQPGLRSYTVQYRETDLDFLERTLRREGLGWRIEEDESAPAGHTAVIFADSPAEASCSEDATSSRGGGIQFHRSAAVEKSDSVQAMGAIRILQAATSTVLAWDDRTGRAVAASAPTLHAFAGANAPRLERYAVHSPQSFATSADAARAAVLAQEAIEARNKTWLGRSTVRTFTPGTTFTLTDSPLDTLAVLSGARQGSADRRFLLTSTIHAGINNLPRELSERAAGLGAGGAGLLADWVPAEVRAQAAATGYGNAFEAIRAHVPWRPALTDGAGQSLPIASKADGPLTATVVGADGSSSGAGEQIHTDRQGRIRIRHDFQPSGSSCWVRVLQRWAGAGMGAQFTPRLGQQVLVGFLDDDLECPLVIAALYDGKGEGGVPATPGGKEGNAADTAVFAKSSDHRPSAQGNTTGGHAPPWHGASPAEHAAGGQRNAAALSGWKTREFGAGEGHNQLVFDDTDSQLRVQMASTQHATQLNLGHLIHQADNHRGSFRGLGFELRTDAYGTVRGAKGLLITTYATNPGEPAGDATAAMALAAQAMELAAIYSGAARTHQAVELAGHIGSWRPWASSLDAEAAPLKALHMSLKGMVSAQSLEQAASDAAAKSTSTEAGKLPHSADPILAVSARAGLLLAAGQDIHIAAGETVSLATGQSADWAVGGAARIHAGQAIGILAGATGPGTGTAGTGITLAAAAGDIELQAQSDTLQIAAKGDVSIQSKGAHIDWAAAKRIVLSTAGGASITLEGGNITVACPGKITVRAGQKSFVGPERASYLLPTLPHQVCVECLLGSAAVGSPFAKRG